MKKFAYFRLFQGAWPIHDFMKKTLQNSVASLKRDERAEALAEAADKEDEEDGEPEELPSTKKSTRTKKDELLDLDDDEDDDDTFGSGNDDAVSSHLNIPRSCSNISQLFDEWEDDDGDDGDNDEEPRTKKSNIKKGRSKRMSCI